MHELACIATQYMPIRVRCIGMYCGMYCGMYWWYVLNTCQHVFNTNRYVFNTYLSVLVCIVLVLGTYWIVIPANTDSIHTTIHTIIHAKYIVHVLVCIAIRANINQHVLACITLVFGMYEMMIRANTDQIHAFFSIRANTDANTFTNTSPIQSNTDLYNLKYRPIQAPQTNAHIIVFNTCFLICQYRHRYCQNRRPRPHRSIGVSEVSELSKPYTAARLLVVGIQFLGVVRQPNFPRRRKFLERLFGGMSLHRRLLGRRIAVNAHILESSDWCEAGIST